MTWKKRILALLLAAVSVLGAACNSDGDDDASAGDTTEETTGDASEGSAE